MNMKEACYRPMRLDVVGARTSAPFQTVAAEALPQEGASEKRMHDISSTFIVSSMYKGKQRSRNELILHLISYSILIAYMYSVHHA